MRASFLIQQAGDSSMARKKPGPPLKRFNKASGMSVLVLMSLILMSAVEAQNSYCCGSTDQFRDVCLPNGPYEYQTIVGNTNGQWSAYINTVQSTDTAWCRCSSPDQTVGVSVCGDGASETCSASWVSPCVPSPFITNVMTYQQCEQQCHQMGMIVPDSLGSLNAAQGTGCGTDSYQTWINQNTIYETIRGLSQGNWDSWIYTVSSSDVAYCRCSTDDNSVGISVCDGNAETCSSDQATNPNAASSCAPVPLFGASAVSYYKCEEQCQNMGMKIPDSLASLEITQSTGCGTDYQQMWINRNNERLTQECPNNTRAGSDCLSCIDDLSSCTTSQYIDSNGFCQNCNTFYRPSTDKLSCIQDTCQSTDIFTYTGECQTCVNSRPDPSNTVCIDDKAYCSDTQFINSTGQCNDCQSNSRPSSDQLSCINDIATCSATQILGDTGYCEACPTLYRASSDYLTCINDKDQCTSSQQLTFNGQCTDCPTNHRSNNARDQCFNDFTSCQITQILDSSGYCIDCPTNYRGNSDKTQCINDFSSCQETQYLNNEGYCKDCNVNYRGSNDKTSCINDFSTCTDTQILTSSGYCSGCPTNFRANSDKTQCINDKDTCQFTDILDDKGYCTPCPDLYRSDSTQLTCINDKDICSYIETLDSTGFCQQCPYNFRANDDRTVCINDKVTCTETQILTSDGYCTDCEKQNRANDEKTECINDADQCPVIVILDDIGHCTVTCEQTKRANEEKTECIDDSEICPDDYIIDGIGLCRIQCRENTIADDDHRTCVEGQLETDDTYYGDYTYDYVDNGGTYYDDYCECEMAYAYLEQYGTPSYYSDDDETETDDGEEEENNDQETYENTYTTPSGEPVYFGFSGTYIPMYDHQVDLNFDGFDFYENIDFTKYSDIAAKNNFVDVTQVVFEKQFEAGKSEDSDYMWITNPSCDGTQFIAHKKDGTQSDLYGTYDDSLLPGPFFRQWFSENYDPTRPDVCVNDDSRVDAYGATCSDFYDQNEDQCYYYDTNEFQASELCCACGGGDWTNGNYYVERLAGQQVDISDDFYVFKQPPEFATDYEEPEFSIQFRQMLSNSTYTVVAEGNQMQCDSGKTVYFGALVQSTTQPETLDTSQAFSQIISDGNMIGCSTSLFGDPLPGQWKYCFCETIETYYGPLAPEPATRFIYIDELMLDESGLTQTGLRQKVQTFLESLSVDMAFLVNGYVEGPTLSGKFFTDAGIKEGTAILQVNQNYPVYYGGFRENTQILSLLISSETTATSTVTSSLVINYVKYGADGQIESINMANGEVWYAKNFFSQPFEYAMVDCTNKVTNCVNDDSEKDINWQTCSEFYDQIPEECGLFDSSTGFKASEMCCACGGGDQQETSVDATQIFQDKITPLLFQGVGHSSECWFTTCDGTNYYFNCYYDGVKDASHRAKAEKNDFGDVVYFELDTDQFFMFQNRGFMSPIRVIYDSNYDPIGLTWEYEEYSSNGPITINMQVTDSFTDNENPYETTCSTRPEDYQNWPYFDMQWAMDLVEQSQGQSNVDDGVCINDDTVSDSYGSTCSALYDANPTYCGELDTATFQSSVLCCACGGGIQTTQAAPTCHNDDQITDSLGYTCSVLYDQDATQCGQYDDNKFKSSDLCCACGGGMTSTNSELLQANQVGNADGWSDGNGCHDRDGNLIEADLCQCHASCGACVALDDGQTYATGPNDCINCADPRYTLSTYWTDGTGSCDVTSDNTDYDYDDSNNGGSYYDSADYNQPPPYECACPEYDEFNFFSWIADFFAWLSSLLDFLTG